MPQLFQPTAERSLGQSTKGNLTYSAPRGSRENIQQLAPMRLVS